MEISCAYAIVRIADSTPRGNSPEYDPWATTAVAIDTHPEGRFAGQISGVYVHRGASYLALTGDVVELTPPGCTGSRVFAGSLDGEGAWNSITCDQDGVLVHFVGDCSIESSLCSEAHVTLDHYLSARRNRDPAPGGT